MGLIDFFVTPLVAVILYIIAYVYMSGNRNFLVKKYFLRGFVLRILGGVTFGFVYFFYYGGGDTFNYHSDGLVFAEAIRNDPIIAWDLYTKEISIENNTTFNYVVRLMFKTDPASHFMSRIGGIVNIFVFDSFLASTILFSLFGFWGSWKLFLTLTKMFPYLHKELAIGSLFLPSILFWTSGIMKDTLCTMALCFLFSALVEFFVYNKRGYWIYTVIFANAYILYVLKIYILMCFLPSMSIYISSILSSKIKSQSIKKIFRPVFLLIGLLLAVYTLNKISEDNSKYSLENIEMTAKITADYIGRVSIKTGGSFYTLGDLDFSISNLPALMGKAFVVTFYRPFFWELKNPLMIFSTIEGIYFFYISWLFLKYLIKSKFKKVFTPFTSFCFTFALIFAFVVGVTSNNFGTLARYKSVMLPFFVCGIYVSIRKKQIN
jgi:hypothetical protein